MKITKTLIEKWHGDDYDAAQVHAYKSLKADPNIYAAIYAYVHDGKKNILRKPLLKRSQKEVQEFIDGFSKGKEAARVVVDVLYRSQLDGFEDALKERGLIEAVEHDDEYYIEHGILETDKGIEETMHKYKLKEADKPAAQSIEDCQKWVDYDMKHYGKISDNTNEIIKKAGFQIVKDDHGDYEVTAGKFEDLKESSKKPYPDSYIGKRATFRPEITNPEEWDLDENEYKKFKRHIGKQCTIESNAISDYGDFEYDYWNIVFDNGFKLDAVQGYDLVLPWWDEDDEEDLDESKQHTSNRTLNKTLKPMTMTEALKHLKRVNEAASPNGPVIYMLNVKKNAGEDTPQASGRNREYRNDDYYGFTDEVKAEIEGLTTTKALKKILDVINLNNDKFDGAPRIWVDSDLYDPNIHKDWKLDQKYKVVRVAYGSGAKSYTGRHPGNLNISIMKR